MARSAPRRRCARFFVSTPLVSTPQPALSFLPGVHGACFRQSWAAALAACGWRAGSPCESTPISDAEFCHAAAPCPPGNPPHWPARCALPCSPFHSWPRPRRTKRQRQQQSARRARQQRWVLGRRLGGKLGELGGRQARRTEQARQRATPTHAPSVSSSCAVPPRAAPLPPRPKRRRRLDRRQRPRPAASRAVGRWTGACCPRSSLVGATPCLASSAAGHWPPCLPLLDGEQHSPR